MPLALAAASLSAPTGVVLLVCAAVLAALMKSRPRLALGFWLVVLAGVPFWLAIQERAILPPTTLAAALVLPVVMTKLPKGNTGWRSGDSLLVAGLFGAGLLVAIGVSPTYTVSTLVLQAGTAYLVGRRVSVLAGETWTYGAVAVMTLAVAAWALIEYAFGWHVYAHVTGPSGLDFWNVIQYRDGHARSEAAWGHSLALGGALTLGIPFVLRLKHGILCTFVVVLAIATTLSRASLVAATLVIALSVLSLKNVSPKRRFLVVCIAIAAAVFSFPTIRARFASAGVEAVDSEQYRQMLLRLAPGDIHWFGRGNNVITTPQGTLLYRGEIGSIDNAFLLMALDLGWVVTGIFVLGLLAALWRALRRHAKVAEVAVAGQIVILATVAMITQYQAALFFVAGVAVAFAQQGKRTPDSEQLAAGDAAPWVPVETMAKVSPGDTSKRG